MRNNNQGGLAIVSPVAIESENALDCDETSPCYPRITGTLCASGAGLSRPAGMCNETDLCIVTQKINDPNASKTKLKNDKKNASDIVAYCLQGNMIGRQEKNGPQGAGVNKNLAFTLNRTDKHCVATSECRNSQESKSDYIVRRLTPTECELLQGYPMGWTEFGDDNKIISDTARYQALGNSVPIPCVVYVLSGIVDEF